jgi:hypothetical protein
MNVPWTTPTTALTSGVKNEGAALSSGVSVGVSPIVLVRRENGCKSK